MSTATVASYSVVTRDNGYEVREGSGLSLEAATKLAESKARAAYGGEWAIYARRGAALPCYAGHGFAVEVRTMTHFTAHLYYNGRNVVGVDAEALGVDAENEDEAEARARSFATERGLLRSLRVEKGW